MLKRLHKLCSVWKKEESYYVELEINSSNYKLEESAIYELAQFFLVIS